MDFDPHFCLPFFLLDHIISQLQKIIKIGNKFRLYLHPGEQNGFPVARFRFQLTRLQLSLLRYIEVLVFLRITRYSAENCQMI